MLYALITTPTDEIFNEDILPPSPALASPFPGSLSVFDIPPAVTPLIEVCRQFKRSPLGTASSAMDLQAKEGRANPQGPQTREPELQSSHDSASGAANSKSLSLRVSEQVWFQQDGRIGMVPKSAITWANPGSLERLYYPFPSGSGLMAMPNGTSDKLNSEVRTSQLVTSEKGEQVDHEQDTAIVSPITPGEQLQQRMLPLVGTERTRDSVQQGFTSACTVCDYTRFLAQMIVDKAKEVHYLVGQLEQRPSKGKQWSPQCKPQSSLVRQVAQKIHFLRGRIGQLDKRMSGQQWHYVSLRQEEARDSDPYRCSVAPTESPKGSQPVRGSC